MTLEKDLIKMEKNNSLFEENIRKIKVPVFKKFQSKGKLSPLSFVPTGKTLETKDSASVAIAFSKVVAASKNKLLSGSKANKKPAKGKRIAVLFSGGPAAGGHNVVAGLKAILGKNNTLLGVKAGPKGLLAGDLFEITDLSVKRILNTGGFDFLGSDRTKIKTDEQFQQVKDVCEKNKLDAIVVVGGDDSNTNAAVLAERLYGKVQVIGVPKTIDGDLQVGDLLPISFGFDTATKIYSEMVGNILQDTPSSRKYWHFIKLMGRAASHVALEVALQTRPAVCLISEEIAEKRSSLYEIIDSIAKIVVARAKKKINHGAVLIPEGLVEFVPEMNVLISELNDALAHHGEADPVSNISASSKQLFTSLPAYIQEMLLAERDSHGNLQVSLIPTERLIIDMVAKRVKEMDPGVKFNTLNHFFGYEGRCGAPSLFDAAYTYNLGLVAGSLILDGKTGYMAALTDLDKGGKALGIPLTGLINIERRQGKDEMVIEKALVKTSSPAFKFFASRREDWASEDKFTSPGPRQLWGPTTKQIPISVALNQGYKGLGFKI
jgi:diphosphate-dependent phosphofructokinase